jgi:hypothetical protein
MVQMFGWFRRKLHVLRGGSVPMPADLAHIFGQKLQRDEAPKLCVLSLVNHAHAATTDFLDNAVVRDDLAAERCLAFGWLHLTDAAFASQ